MNVDAKDRLEVVINVLDEALNASEPQFIALAVPTNMACNMNVYYVDMCTATERESVYIVCVCVCVCDVCV